MIGKLKTDSFHVSLSSNELCGCEILLLFSRIWGAGRRSSHLRYRYERRFYRERGLLKVKVMAFKRSKSRKSQIMKVLDMMLGKDNGTMEKKRQ